MKSLTRHLIPLFALAVALAACRAEEPVAAQETPPAKANPDLFYIPGRVSVQFDDATTRMVEEALAQGQPTKVSALDGLLENPVNPYTGNPVVSHSDEGADVICAMDTKIQGNEDTRLWPYDAFWYHVEENIFDPECWTEITPGE
jgi:hypothetical protein